MMLKIRELNWKRNFLFKKIRVFIKYYFSFLIYSIFRRENNYDVKSIKKILLIRNDLIGDMVATTGLIRNLSISGYDIYVSSKKQSLEIIKYNKYVKNTFVYDDSSLFRFLKTINNIRKYNFDLAIECKPTPTVSIRNALYYGLLKTSILLGFNQEKTKIFNASINCKVSNIHITEQLEKILSFLEINNQNDLSYEIFTNQEIDNYATNQLPKDKFVVLNPFGSQSHRCFNSKQIKHITKVLNKQNYKVILIGEYSKISNINIDSLNYFKSRQILDIIPVIKLASLVISVDTSIVHIATAFQKKSIIFYLEPILPHLAYSDKNATMKDKLSHDFYKFKISLEHNTPRNNPNTLWDLFPINSIYWSPNNPAAIQIIFRYKNLTDIPSDELIKRLEQSLTEL